jgi:hypothetical protein
MLKVYRTIATPGLLYGNETWVPTKKIQSRIQCTEMILLQKIMGCRKLECIRNESVRAEMNVFPTNEVTEQCRNNWLQHINKCKTQDHPRKHFITDFQERDT